MPTMPLKERCSLTLLLVLALAITVRSNLIDETCNRNTDPYNCNEIIRADPRSATAKGPLDLGIIVVDKVDQIAQEAITRITPLINQTSDPKMRTALSKCEETYISTVSEWVPGSKDAFIANVTREAVYNMTATSNAAYSCEVDLRNAGKSPISDLSLNAQISARVALSIARNLQG